jgi:hypothetical protein
LGAAAISACGKERKSFMPRCGTRDHENGA